MDRHTVRLHARSLIAKVAVAALFGVGSGSVQVRIAAGSDDVEKSATGSYSATSSDLGLVYDTSNRRVGLRFPGLAIPAGATITDAYVQFEADETQSEATTLAIQGVAADTAGKFGGSLTLDRSRVSPRGR